MPISFPWANALVYRAVGEEPPRRAVAKAVARVAAKVVAAGVKAALADVRRGGGR